MSFEFETITDEVWLNVERQTLKGKSAAYVTPTNLSENFPIELSGPRPCVLTNRYKDYAEKIKNFEVRSDDTWVVTYPKSGTTWTQEMIWLLKNNLDFETAKKTLLTMRFPCVEICGLIEVKDNIDTTKVAAQMPSPRFIKSHLPIQFLPDQLWAKNPKIVYVKRGVKDVAVSFYHYLKILHGYSGTMEEHIDCFVRDNLLYSPFFSHVVDFCEAAEKLDNILVLSYEDMIKDLASVIKVTAKFLDVSVSESDVEKLVDHLSFKNMRENKAVNFESHIETCIKQSGIDPKSFDSKYKNENIYRQVGWFSTALNRDDLKFFFSQFIRKGEVGGWKTELSSEMFEKLDDWIKRNEEANPLIKKCF